MAFEGKVVLVTGGNSGFGAATIGAFVAQGAKVANFDLAEKPAATSDSVHYVQCNVASEESVNAAVASVITKFGHIDILVNNAGVMDDMSRVADTTNEMWTKVIGVNVNGPFNMLRAVIPHLLKNDPQPAADAPPSITRFGKPGPPRVPSKGSIINICSTASFHGGAAGAAYTTSKHALLGLSRNTAWMYRKEGIRTNAILPGGAATGIYQNSAVSLNPDGYAALQPYMGCHHDLVIMPDAIANAVLFLANPASENINGAELAVDDAWTAA